MRSDVAGVERLAREYYHTIITYAGSFEDPKGFARQPWQLPLFHTVSGTR